MFDAIAKLFSSSPDTAETPLDPKLAVAALLVHLIDVDGQTTQAERQTVRRILQEQYDLDNSQVEKLIAAARKKDAESVDFYRFTSILTRLEMDQRIKIIAMMWEVVFADSQNHELEDNMVWRVAELIGVSARDRTTLRARFARKALSD